MYVQLQAELASRLRSASSHDQPIQAGLAPSGATGISMSVNVSFKHTHSQVNLAITSSPLSKLCCKAHQSGRSWLRRPAAAAKATASNEPFGRSSKASYRMPRLWHSCRRVQYTTQLMNRLTSASSGWLSAGGILFAMAAHSSVV